MSFRRFLVGVVAIAAGGCVDNDRSLTVTKFVSPTGTCMIDATGTTSTSHGTWDVTLATTFDTSYRVFFGVKNVLMPLNDSPIETQAFYVDSYDVQLEPIGAVESAVPAASREFNVPAATVRLGPGDTTSAGIEGIPATLATGIAALSAKDLGTIVVHVRPVATRAEEQVHGAYSSFPVEICNGCLFEDLGVCPVPAATTIHQGGACGPQDEALSCCQDAMKGTLCGADVPFAMATP